ncbi:MAG: inorganic diphosphatase [Actinomycetota bacterium]
MLLEEPTFPACRISANAIGLFRMWDKKGPDEKILWVPLRDPQWSRLRDIEEVPSNLLAEIGHFFQVYKMLAGRFAPRYRLERQGAASGRGPQCRPASLARRAEASPAVL